MGRFIPPDHSKGDESTLGGYMAVHDRPAAFEGSDGMSYSVDVAVDDTGDPGRPYGAYLLFLRWRRVGSQGVEGHLETDYLARGASEDEARAAIGAMPLAAVKATLETLLSARRGPARERKWWDVMRDEGREP
jgi:hypothetical protein